MKTKKILKIISFLIPVSVWRKKFRATLNKKTVESALAHHYLDGLNGIEIGASRQNSFGLDKTPGWYANVDFGVTQGGKWQNSLFKPATVNVVACGDDLPFRDGSLDYILSSHVIEHFFDPIKALKEWLRVIKKGGYLFILVPHKERTFDSKRQETSVKELSERHCGNLKITDYAHLTEEEMIRQGFIRKGCSTSDNPDMLVKDKEIPLGWTRFKEDDHHHWSVWKTEGFLELCHFMKLNIIEYHDVDDRGGNGFTFVIKK